MKLTKKELKNFIYEMINDSHNLSEMSFSLLPLLAGAFTACSNSDTEFDGENIIIYEFYNPIDDPLLKQYSNSTIYENLDLKGSIEKSDVGFSQDVLLFTKEVLPANDEPIRGIESDDFDLYKKSLYCLWNNIELPSGEEDMRIVGDHDGKEEEYFAKPAVYFDEEMYQKISKSKLGVIPSYLKDTQEDVILPIKMFVFVKFEALYKVPKNTKPEKDIKPIGYTSRPQNVTVFLSNHKNCYSNLLSNAPDREDVQWINTSFNQMGINPDGV
jgi:hypothetical protein